MLKGFREFVMRGNVIDLAVGVVIGIAFGALVKAVVDGLVQPLVGAIFGKPNLDGVGHFTIGKGDFNIGIILTQLINFLLIALVLYLVVVVPVNALRRRMDRDAEAAAPTEVELLEQIRDELRAAR